MPTTQNIKTLLSFKFTKETLIPQIISKMVLKDISLSNNCLYFWLQNTFYSTTRKSDIQIHLQNKHIILGYQSYFIILIHVLNKKHRYSQEDRHRGSCHQVHLYKFLHWDRGWGYTEVLCRVWWWWGSCLVVRLLVDRRGVVDDVAYKTCSLMCSSFSTYMYTIKRKAYDAF